MRSITRLPVPLFFIAGALSLYLGAAIGVLLFQTTQPATVAWLRAAMAAVVLMVWRRPWRVLWTRRDLRSAVWFGFVTVGMNVAFYEAIARIPLGAAVAIEFSGPVAVACLESRSRRDVTAAVLVAAGVALVSDIRGELNWAGVGFALLAAATWAGYILLGKRVSDSGGGLDSLAVGMAVAAVVLAVPLVAVQLAADAAVFVDPRTWILGMGVGVLSTAVPYALDQLVLTRIGRARFSLLLALLPATAAAVGWVVLRQRPATTELVGISLVMVALVISAHGRDSAVPEPGHPL